MSEIVKLFDTTLRDGEQSPGISLNVQEKLEIADQIAALGADIIEAGFPAASKGDFEAVKAISKKIKNSAVCGLARTNQADIDVCWNAVKYAEQPRIHVFIATSEIHMKHKLRMSQDQVLEAAEFAVKHAKRFTSDVEFSPEDASRSDFDFMCEVLQAAADAGAATLNIPDTVGYDLPETYADKIRRVRERVSGDYVLSTHCHDDLGLAVANSLAGVAAGARQVECAINGIGERAGNAALEEVAMAIKTRPDFFADLDVSINPKELQKTSRLVSRLTGYPVQCNKAVVGRNAFAHESGIHQHGVLRERTTYEIMDPVAVGKASNDIVLGKHSGRHAFSDRLSQLGYDISGDRLNQAFDRFKELADRKPQISDSDIEAIIADHLGQTAEDVFVLELLECFGGSKEAGTPKAVVTISKNGEETTVRCEGDGMIDAACSAVKAATGMQGRLQDYSVMSVTGGVDALADVSLRFVSETGESALGKGLATDVVEASVRAFLNAVNRIASSV